MELRHLRYFVAVGEQLNFRRAALRLHVSQPPLSRQIHDLEDELGTKLFDRSNRKLALTAAGECFLKEARQILFHVERASQLAKAASRGEAGQLNLASCHQSADCFYRRRSGRFANDSRSWM
jgi:DNA-binding transcriptional LysR family regulator